MASPKELATSRRNASVSAWVPIIGVVTAAILAGGTSYLGARAGIGAENDRQTVARQNLLQDLQVKERKDAYEKFLSHTQKAASFEKAFWCFEKIDGDPEVPTSTDIFHVCDKAPSVVQGRILVDQLEEAVIPVLLYAGDDARGQAYGVIQDLSGLLDTYSKEGRDLKATDSPSDSFQQHAILQRDFFTLASTMCKEQSLLPNGCNPPGK